MCDDFEIGVSTMEGTRFWLAEFTKRRIYLENKDNYHDILFLIRWLNDFSNFLKMFIVVEDPFTEATVIEKKIPNSYIIDSLLRNYKYHKNIIFCLDEITTTSGHEILNKTHENLNAIECKIECACDLSIKYGYLITEMGLNPNLHDPADHELFQFAVLREKSYWKKQFKNNPSYHSIEKNKSGSKIIALEKDSLPMMFEMPDDFENSGIIQYKVDSQKEHTDITIRIKSKTYQECPPTALINEIKPFFFQTQRCIIQNHIDKLNMIIYKKKILPLKLEDRRKLFIELEYIRKTFPQQDEHFYDPQNTPYSTELKRLSNILSKTKKKIDEHKESKLAQSNGNQRRVIALIGWDLVNIGNISLNEAKDLIFTASCNIEGFSDHDKKNLNTRKHQLQNDIETTIDKSIKHDWIYSF